jgi:ABC-2 type transport system permease protein
VPARRIRTVAEQESAGAEVTLADRAPVFVAGALAYFLWLMVFSIIQYLLMGTIEERSNKIFDTLLTSVRMPELLAGKLLAVFAVTSTMMAGLGPLCAVGLGLPRDAGAGGGGA